MVVYTINALSGRIVSKSVDDFCKRPKRERNDDMPGSPDTSRFSKHKVPGEFVWEDGGEEVVEMEDASPTNPMPQ